MKANSQASEKFAIYNSLRCTWITKTFLYLDDNNMYLVLWFDMYNIRLQNLKYNVVLDTNITCFLHERFYLKSLGTHLKMSGIPFNEYQTSWQIVKLVIFKLICTF